MTTNGHIDFSDPVNRVLVGLTCGPEGMPEGGVHDISRECETAAIVIGGALSEYCGCPCKHPEDPVCNPNALPEERASLLPRHFEELGEELRQILTSSDPTKDNSFVSRFYYCADEVPAAYNQLMSAHTLPEPADPEGCAPILEEDPDIMQRPYGFWFPLSISVGVLPYDTMSHPWTFRLGLIGYSPVGFYGGIYGTFSANPTKGDETGSSDRDSSMLFAAGGLATAGYYFWLSHSFGLQLHADLEAGGQWSNGETHVATDQWVDNIKEFYLKAGTGLDIMLWFLEGFAVLMGLQYLGTVTDTVIPRHQLEFAFKFQFRGF